MVDHPSLSDRRTPPGFCQYPEGPCDQTIDGTAVTRAVVLYPSEPEQLAATIEEARRRLEASEGARQWLTWKQFQTTGQIVFCGICKTMRFTDFVVADVTTLNFNLLFEI